MSTDPSPTRPEDAPGHYGAGYGEQVPEGAPPRLAPATDDDAASRRAKESPGAPPRDRSEAALGDDGQPVVFTPDDVGARPPDHPPTGKAPESEKVGLIFERS